MPSTIRHALGATFGLGVVPAKLPGDAGRVIYWSVSFWAPSGSVQERDIITDQNGKVDEVKGNGVVGQQPLIAPGHSYQYSSGAVLQTEIGDMHGSYTMQDADGELFDAPIPLFVLAVPHMLH